MAKRYKATFKTRFSFGFDAINKQNAQIQIDTIKANMLKAFKKEYGENVAVSVKLEELPL